MAKASFYQHFSSKEELCVSFLNQRHTYWFDELKKYTSSFKTTRTRVIGSFDFLIAMNKKENFRGCSFLNILSEISSDNKKILSVIQEHKRDLSNYFKNILEEHLLADHDYLLFESSILESQLFRSNRYIDQSKKIIKQLLS